MFSGLELHACIGGRLLPLQRQERSRWRARHSVLRAQPPIGGGFVIGLIPRSRRRSLSADRRMM